MLDSVVPSSFEKAYKESFEEGRMGGRMEMTKEILCAISERGMSPEKISELTDIDIQTVRRILKN